MNLLDSLKRVRRWLVGEALFAEANCRRPYRKSPRLRGTPRRAILCLEALEDRIVPITTTTSVISSVDPSTFGQSVTLTATVNPNPGTFSSLATVQFAIDGTDYGAAVHLGSSNSVSVNDSALGAGNHTVTASFNGDDKHSLSASMGTLAGGQVVNPTATTTTVYSPLNPSFYGQQASFTATVEPASTFDSGGTVQFAVDGASDGSPIAFAPNTNSITISQSNLSVGTHAITATYSGDSNFSGSSGDVGGGEIVNQAGTTTTLTSQPNPSATGQQVSFTATVTPSSGTFDSGGTVQFAIDGTSDGPPIAFVDNASSITISQSDLNAGVHTITATYSGDTDFSASSGTLPGGQTVLQTTITTLTATPNPANYGDSVVLVAAVIPTSGTFDSGGTVQFAVDGASDGAPISFGANTNSITFSQSNLSVGTHAITATYSGDSNFSGSSGDVSGGEIVDQAGTTTTLTSAPNPSNTGQEVSITATVAPSSGTFDSSGTVQFAIDGTNDGPPMTFSGNGNSITITPANLGLGTHTVTATYSGDTDFSGSNGTLAGGQTVLEATATSVSADPNPAVVGTPAVGDSFSPQQVTYTATVSNTGGTADTPTGAVDFFDTTDNADLGTGTLSNGTASVTSSTAALGSFSVVATYLPTGNFAVSQASMTEAVEASTSTTVSAAPAPGVFGQPVVLTAMVANEFNSGGTPNDGTVDFVDTTTNVDLGTAPVVNGSATMNTSSLSLGSHNLVATYTPTVTDNFAGSQGFTTAQIDVGDFWTKPAGGAWDDPTNWSNGVPQASYDVYFDDLDATASIILGQTDVANNITINAPNTVGGSAYTLTFSGTQTQPGGLTVGGTVTVNVGSGSPTYTLTFGGTTTSVMVQVGGSFTIGGSVTVMDGSTFSGQGTVKGDLINDGELDMGQTPGAIAVQGNYTQGSTGMLTVKVAGPIAGDVDQLHVMGIATLDSTLNVNLIDDFIPAANETLLILNLVQPATGSFATVHFPQNGGVAYFTSVNSPGGLNLVGNSAGTSVPSATVTFAGVPAWQPEGPQPAFGRDLSVTSPVNEAVGAISSVVVAPHTFTNILGGGPITVNTLYAGTVNGGVWRADNVTDATLAQVASSGGYFGISWTPMTDPQPSLGVASMALDPEDPSGNTLWVGTGELSSNGTGGPSVGLLETTDGGSVWTQFGASIFNSAITSVLPTGITDATTGKEVILIGTNNQGLWRYDGVNFKQVLSQPIVSSLIVDPQNPQRFYAALDVVGIFESFDAGLTWFEIDGSLPQLTSSTDTQLTATINQDGNTNLYAVTSQASTAASAQPWGNVIGGLWRTEVTSDSLTPLSWQPISNTPTNSNLVGGNHFSMIGDPTDPDVVYVCGPVQDLYRVTITGLASDKTLAGSWSPLSGGSLGKPHDDQRFLTFLNKTTMLNTDDGGIYSLNNPLNPSPDDRWVALSGNIQDTEFFQVAYDSIYGVIFGGTQDNGTLIQQSSGAQWWDEMDGGDGGAVAVDNSAVDPIYYAFADENLDRISQSGSVTLVTVPTNNDASYPIAVNTFSPDSPEPHGQRA